MDNPDMPDELSVPVASAPVRRVCQGPVMPIGGAEDKDPDGDEAVLGRFLALAGGTKARIAVVPTASEDPEAMGQQYVEVFGTLGAKSVAVLDVRARPDANADPAVDLLGGAGGIFLMGGDQVLTVVDAHLSVLGPGRRFDIDARRPLPA